MSMTWHSAILDASGDAETASWLEPVGETD
jgi:hypothetical protein